MRTKDQIQAEVKRETAKAKRLVERRDLASANLTLVQERLADLGRKLKTAPDGWRGY